MLVFLQKRGILFARVSFYHMVFGTVLLPVQVPVPEDKVPLRKIKIP